MLVLTRRIGETIRIDGDVTIQIVQIQGKQVRVGIEAPKSKQIKRGELLPPLGTESILLVKKAGSLENSDEKIQSKSRVIDNPLDL